MYRRIMVPLDGSSFAEVAIPTALSIAEGRDARIDLVTVPDTPPYADWQRRVQEAAASYLERAAERVREGAAAEVATTLLHGAVAPALEEFAESYDVDLIVMATHGRGPFSRLWLGSVADELVRHSPCPVLLLRPNHNGAAQGAPPAFRSVLVPLDGSEVAETAVEHALAVGRGEQARYTLLRVVRHPDELVSVYLPDTIQMTREMVEEGKREAEDYLERVAAGLRSRGLDVETHVVVESRPASAILKHAHENGIDLLVMATHGRGGLTRTVLGSVTDKVLRGTHKPILVHRPG